jgi:predicted O-methyltransferase YrrM
MTALSEEYARRLAVWSDVQDCLERFYAETSGRPGVRVLELGVRAGNSTSALLAGAEASGGHVWSADINAPASEVPAEWFISGRWTFILSDSVTMPLPAGVTFDVVFIDSSHAYEHTLAELRRFVPLVAPGGTVLMHDTRYEPIPWEVGGVPQPHFPVARALDAFCAETGRSWTDHDAQFGLGEIAQPNG